MAEPAPQNVPGTLVDAWLVRVIAELGIVAVLLQPMMLAEKELLDSQCTD